MGRMFPYLASDFVVTEDEVDAIDAFGITYSDCLNANAAERENSIDDASERNRYYWFMDNSTVLAKGEFMWFQVTKLIEDTTRFDRTDKLCQFEARYCPYGSNPGAQRAVYVRVTYTHESNHHHLIRKFDFEDLVWFLKMETRWYSLSVSLDEFNQWALDEFYRNHKPRLLLTERLHNDVPVMFKDKVRAPKVLKQPTVNPDDDFQDWVDGLKQKADELDKQNKKPTWEDCKSAENPAVYEIEF